MDLSDKFLQDNFKICSMNQELSNIIKTRKSHSPIAIFSSSTEGFTLFELVMVVCITLILFGFISINLFRTQRVASLDGDLQSFMADLKSQQIKAMVGATDGRAAADNYGIHFNTNKYTLFHGLVFNPTDPANFNVNLDDNINFNPIGFNNNTLVFLQNSGEVSTFSASANTVTIKNISGTEQRVITINKYGVISNIQ